MGRRMVFTTRTRTWIAKGRDCGNAIILDHGNGWETQYCHLKEGSLDVQRSMPVKAGDKIGEVGMSGRTVFPHLHFECALSGKCR